MSNLGQTLLIPAKGASTSTSPAFTTPADVPGIALFLSDTSWSAAADTDPVTTWPDLSGNSRNATQSVAGQKPRVKKTGVTGFTRDTVNFDAGDGLATAGFTLTSCTKLVHYVIHRHNASNLGILLEVSADATAITDGFFQYVAAGASPVYRTYHRGNVGDASFDSFETVPVSATVFHLIGAIHDKDAPLKEVMPITDNIAGHGTINTDSNNTSGGFFVSSRVLNIGSRDASGTLALGTDGDISAVVVADATNWGTNRGYWHMRIESYLRTRYLGASAYNVNLVFEGDSRTYGTGVTAALDYPARVLSRIGTSVPRINNIGVPSQTMVQAAADASTQVDDYFVRGISPMKNVVVVWGGVNDAAAGDSAATIYASIKSYCQARKTAGFQVIVCTETPAKSAAAIAGGWDAKRLTINTNITTNAVSEGWANAVADLAANAAFDADADADNATYYNADKIHLTATGYDLVASIVYAALATVSVT